MKKYKLSFFLLTLIILMIGCSENLNSDSANAKASNSAISEKKTKLNEKEVPIPKVTSLDKKIEVVQSSYCWGTLGCKDYVGGTKMVDGKRIIELNPGTKIKIKYDYNPIPTEIILSEISKNDNKRKIISLKNNEFIVPTKQGNYYYELYANWSDSQKKYSIGDTSSIFAITVK